jgi:hypothetical protein
VWLCDRHHEAVHTLVEIHDHRLATAHETERRAYFGNRLRGERESGSRARKRNSDDYNGLGLLVVTALRQPIPLPVHEPTTHERASRCGDELPLEDFNRESRARGLPGTVSAAAARSCLVRRAV